MSLPASTTEVVTMYEELDMTPDQIALDTGYELGAIEAILANSSKVYRRVIREQQKLSIDKRSSKSLTTTEEVDPCPHISEDDLFQAYKTIKELSAYGECEGVKAKCAMRVIDEKKGRMDKLAAASNMGNVNIIFFNEQLLKARQAKERALNKLNKDALEVSSEKIA